MVFTERPGLPQCFYSLTFNLFWNRTVKKNVIRAGLCTLALWAASAAASPLIVFLNVLPSVDDVHLVQHEAGQFELLGTVNPQGSSGNGALAAHYGPGWSTIAAFDSSGNAVSAYGQTASPLSFTFSLAPGNKNGVWSVTNTLQDSDISVDLAFAMVSDGLSGAWLFEQQTILAGATASGDWIQRLINDAGSQEAFASLTLFSRALVVSGNPPTGLPEPASLASFLLGLLTLGIMHRRQRCAPIKNG